ncbi:tRNA pseudouridine(55) synthase TruB [Galbitalea sp. SE-J8]|uniref:tRNA pseudouridine(55) synthase TruB n=1 Tax=Galbitalea sp. SE-J8 TaxID=3054952 RepID=UPI00259CB090|nr:tRNA pseudouridine(55) synthase TruB [Galbitalea sp. SE-J8]MDM4762631.1 tRNA pseudouridine(55) synthase TruB [Galbitalea sp. SE-J8]
MTSGILLVDKPGGVTSHDVVARARRALGTRKVGHAGTLDPMATGLLVLGVDSSTRLLTYLVGLDKVYSATIRFGVATDSDDADGAVTATTDAAHLTDARLTAALAGQVGDRDQVPSAVSAIKVDGRRAYDRVRAGETVELAARRVRIESIDVLGVRRPGADGGDATVDVDVRVACSSGTYIRAIARDAGDETGVGAHLVALRRDRVGPFDVADAVPMVEDADRRVAFGDGLAARLREPASVASALFATRALDDAEALALRQGKRVPIGSAAGESGPIAAIDPDGVLVGIAERRGDSLRAVTNFPVAASGSAAPDRDRE